MISANATKVEKIIEMAYAEIKTYKKSNGILISAKC